MSKFYVGQRVRIVGAINLTQFNGREATVVARVYSATARPGYEHGWALSIDHEVPPPTNGARSWAPWQDYQLAPAYDGNEKVSWSECLWQPSPERVA